MELIILGSGTSGCVPNISCLIDSNCKVCLSCSSPNSKNRRRNTSALLRITKDNETKTILIDCGKTFYSSCIDYFPQFGITTIDGVLLTHGHADAVFGIDDLRGWTLKRSGQPGLQDTIKVYCDSPTFDVVKRSFPYTVDKREATGSGEVPSIQYNIIDPNKIFTVAGIDIQPFQGTLS
jgi:ribonuclease BN (tRNA processing enzyme)